MKHMRIALINLPFGRIDYPSLALTQCRAVIGRTLPEADCEILYLNHDFANFFGIDAYQILLGDSVYLKTGCPPGGKQAVKSKELGLNNSRDYVNAGEWMFRSLAFGETGTEDPYADEFLNKSGELKRLFLQKRRELDRFADDVINQYALDTYDIICFTSLFQQQSPIAAIGRKIKNLNSNIIMIAGGCNFNDGVGLTWLYEGSPIDYILQGPGLKSLAAVLDCIKNEQDPKCADIPGLIYSGISPDKIRDGIKTPLHEIPPLDYTSYLDSFDRFFSGTGIEPILFFQTSEGCWWGEKSPCIFCDCTVNSFEYHSLSPKQALESINDILKRFSDRCRYFWAVDAVMDQRYYAEVLPFIDHGGKDIHIFYEIRANLKKQQVKQLADAKINLVQAGIEALCNDQLRKMRKGTTAVMNLAILKNCTQYGISVLWNLLTGVPGETLETLKIYKNLIPSIVHLCPPTGLWPISYDRGCDLVQNKDEYGLVLEEDISNLQYVFPFQDHELKQMAYFFKNKNAKQQYQIGTVLMIQKINEIIDHWQDKWKKESESILPRLYLDEKQVLSDTRTGFLQQTQLSDREAALLEFLDQGCTITQLETQWAGFEAELAHLSELGLVWMHEHQAISLVMLDKPLLPGPYSSMIGWIWK